MSIMTTEKNTRTKKPRARKKTVEKKAPLGDMPDTLGQYMGEISKMKPLTREEEAALSKKIQKGDVKALHKLVRRNLKYVVTVANKYRGCGLSMQDLIEEGNIGLIQAAKRFDGSRQVKFITYAVWWIRQAIMHSLAEQSGTVKLPIKQAGKLYKIERKYKSFNDLVFSALNDFQPCDVTCYPISKGFGFKINNHIKEFFVFLIIGCYVIVVVFNDLS